MYKIAPNGVIRLHDGAVIPQSLENTDWLSYLAWLDQGNEPQEADSTARVPSEVTMRQARLALHQAGFLPTVESAINAMPEPPRTAARIEWDYSNAIQRDNQFVAQLGAILGLTSTQLDELFIQAAGL